MPRLIAELPHDEFRVALVLHPNVWSSHSSRQIEAWLAEALRSGLLLIPPHEGWRAAVTAADLVVSDHGSVSVYAAAIGRPVLLATDGRTAIDPDSGLGRLYEVAHPLDPHRPLRGQHRLIPDSADIMRLRSVVSCHSRIRPRAPGAPAPEQAVPGSPHAP